MSEPRASPPAWLDSGTLAAHRRAVDGPLQRLVTSPLTQIREDRDELLDQRVDAEVALPPRPAMPIDDRHGIAQLVESTYELSGWSGVDELRWQALVVSLSRGSDNRPRARAATVLVERIDEATYTLGRRIAVVLRSVNAELRPAVLDVLAKSKEAAAPTAVGLVRTGDTWSFDGGQVGQASIGLMRRYLGARAKFLAALAPVVSGATDVITMTGTRQDWPTEQELDLARTVIMASPETLERFELFRSERDEIVKDLWLLDRCAESLRDGIDADLASTLGEASEEVVEANAKVVAAIGGQGEPWAWAGRPDMALAEFIETELSAWRYRMLVTAVAQAMGYVPGTFEWRVVEGVFDQVDVLTRDSDELDATIGQNSAVVGLLALLPPMRAGLAPVVAALATWRLYRSVSRSSVDEPAWWAIVDPDFSSRAHPPSMVGLLIAAGLDVLDIVGLMPVARLLAACRRHLLAGVLEVKLTRDVHATASRTQSAALFVATTELRAAEVEINLAAAEMRDTYALRSAQAAAAVKQRTASAASQKVAPSRSPEVSPAHTATPPPGIPKDLANRLVRLNTALAKVATAADPAPHPPAQSIKVQLAPPAVPPGSRQRSPTPKKQPTRRKRPETSVKRRRRLGVPLRAEILRTWLAVDSDSRPYRGLVAKLGDPVRRVDRTRPDLEKLLPPDVIPRLRAAYGDSLGHDYLHLVGPGWGIDENPKLFGAYLFNRSAQARLENACRRLSEVYLREGHRIHVMAIEHAQVPTAWPGAHKFVSEVVYTIAKGGPPTSQNVVVRFSIQSTTPRIFAETGQAVDAVDVYPGPLFLDAVSIAPQGTFTPFKRSAAVRVPRGGKPAR